jgi:histidine triad (HIT) family protein
MEDCIFCKIIRGEIPSVKLFEDERVFSFMDINPISDGHSLIIPKNHAANLWEIDTEDLLAIHSASKRLAEAMRQALDVEGIAVLQLNGTAVNQVVFHYHLHLIPRLSGAPEIPLTKWELVSGDMEQIKQLGERIATRMG